MLRRHGKLAAKRHPMYDMNRLGKWAARIGAMAMAAYLIFFGVMMALALSEESREAYHLMGGGFVIIMLLDFLVRMPFQKLPSQEVKPYLLMPVKRRRVIDFLLVRSGLDTFNLFWLFFFVPFAFLSIFRFYGLLGVLFYSLGVWLLMLFNNYWYLLCRTLTDEHIAWTLLPVAFYGGLIAALFIPDESPIFYGSMLLSDGFVKGNPLAFLAVIIPIAVLFLISRALMARLFYNEVNKVEDTKVRVSDYNFFERYGDIGEYMRLDVKMMLRNKTCKTQLRTVAVLMIAFSGLLSFTDVYDGSYMTHFIVVYNFAIFGMTYLTNLMAYEGNYIDGLMSRKESIYTLLRAKYLLYSIALVIPGLMMVAPAVMGKITFATILSWMLFTAGPMYCLLFQLAVYNKKTTPLNAKITGRQNMGTSIQNIISVASFGLPLLVYPLLVKTLGDATTNVILSLIGIAFIATNRLWMKNVYDRFMKRRYENMAGFRDTRG
jgi:hypothetical protein